LDLGANRIRELPPNFLANCALLKSLWLGKNKIERIGVEAGLANLTKLTKLDVQNNRLLRVESGELPLAHSLQELYLACNGISEFLPDISRSHDGAIHQLQTLDLSRNPIKDLSFTSAFADSLEELWLTGIAIDNKEQILPLASLSNISCVYLEHSPLQKSMAEADYKDMLKSVAPSLTQIDALCL
jgi:Leucine-rich repeat (LRR) protein